MSGRRLVAGVDCSTQSTKVIVIDADTGEQLALGRAQHTVTGTGGARETHPDVW
jgi:xylulokinase